MTELIGVLSLILLVWFVLLILEDLIKKIITPKGGQK